MHRPPDRKTLLNLVLAAASPAIAGMRLPFHWRSFMSRAPWPMVSGRSVVRRGLAFWLLAALTAMAAPGCGAKPKAAPSVATPPSVQLIQPPTRNIIRVVSQPSFVESFERTSIFPKLAGFIKEWKVDIGDQVKKGDILATLFIPELVEDLETKKADVELAKVQIDLALKMVTVQEADVKSARAHLDETKADLEKYQADFARWGSEVERLTSEVQKGVIDPQILLESTNQHKAAKAARDSAEASILKAKADVLSQEAATAKAKVDVMVARARLAVAQSDERRLNALVGYITLTAPFDGVVVVRNANTGDFVLPERGDPTASERSPNLSPSGSAPVYVVERTDKVRIFVDIPERDANHVHIGSKASVVVKAYRGKPISATVTRTAWTLNVKSRTLRAEIDLPNPEGLILPGMYAYGKVVIERPGVRALPLAALTYNGDQTFCWKYEKGKAVRTAIQTGISDGEWIEITNVQLPPAPNGDDPWMPIDGSEQVILGDLTVLADNEPVQVVPAATATEVAGTSAKPAAKPGDPPVNKSAPDGLGEASNASAKAAGTKF